MPRPDPFDLNTTHRERAYIIEVLDEDARAWTAMAQEYERISWEMRNAPVAVAITIYLWELAKPINNSDTSPFRYPVWKFVREFPWRMEEPEDLDGD